MRHCLNRREMEIYLLLRLSPDNNLRLAHLDERCTILILRACETARTLSEFDTHLQQISICVRYMGNSVNMYRYHVSKAIVDSIEMMESTVCCSRRWRRRAVSAPASIEPQPTLT